MDRLFGRTRILASPEEDQAAILSFFKKVEGGVAARIRLLNYFQEVPVSHEAFLVKVNDESVLFEVHLNQIPPLSLEKRTIIVSSGLEHPVMAMSHLVMASNRTALLKDFRFADLGEQQRQCVRVGLKVPMKATFSFGSRPVTGEVIDISSVGIAVYTPFPVPPTPHATKVEITLPSTPGKPAEKMAISAKVVRTITDGKQHRCALALSPTPYEEDVITQFVFQRQTEIARELNELAQELSRGAAA